MEKDLTLKKTAKILLQKGYRVLGWESKHPYKGREYDFTSIDFGKEIGGVWSIRFDNLEGFVYSFKYVPSKKVGSGCHLFSSGTVTMEEIERLIDSSCPSWVRGITPYRSFDEFAKRELKFYDFKREIALDELKDIEI